MTRPSPWLILWLTTFVWFNAWIVSRIAQIHWTCSLAELSSTTCRHVRPSSVSSIKITWLLHTLTRIGTNTSQATSDRSLTIALLHVISLIPIIITLIRLSIPTKDLLKHLSLWRWTSRASHKIILHLACTIAQSLFWRLKKIVLHATSLPGYILILSHLSTILH